MVIIDLEVHFHWYTPEAIKVSTDGEDNNAVWLPKSIVEYDEETEVGTVIKISLPERTAIDKGLV